MKAGVAVDPVTDRSQGHPKTHEVVAPAVGMSGTQWQRLKHIGDRAAAGDEAAAETLERIDKRETTVSSGYTALRQRDVTGMQTDLGNVGDKRSIPRRRGPGSRGIPPGVPSR